MNIKPHWQVLAPEGDDGTGGGGDGGGKGADGKGGAGGDKDGKGSENSEMVMRGLAVVAKGITDLGESNKQVLEFLKAQAEKGGGKGKDDDDEDVGGKGTPLFEGVDMEQLDRKDFAALLLSKFEERLSHHMKEAVKPLDERLGKVSERLEEDLAGREVGAAAGTRPDFYEWRSEIAALVKDNPNLSVTRAYAVARSENADKSKKMDEKYTKKSDSTAPTFVGFTPTGGGGRGEGAGKMKFNEAAEKAYADVLASLGGVSLDQLPVVGGKGR